MAITLRIAAVVVASTFLILCMDVKAALLALGFCLCGGTWQFTRRGKELLEDIERARQRAGLTHGQLATAQGLDPAQWHKQRNGYLGQQPGACRLAEVEAHERELIPLRAERHGLIVLPRDEVSLALQEIVEQGRGRKVMARMRLREKREKERTA